MDSVERGSQTAKSGFRNEDDIIIKFNNWAKDPDAQKWLVIMGYKLEDIEYVRAVKIHKEKSDVQAQITIKSKKIIEAENMQVKLVTIEEGYNQIDKRWVNDYSALWNIPDDIAILLKHFSGEIPPKIDKPDDPRRMFMFEFEEQEQEKIISFFEANKLMVLNDILKGRGKLAAEWMLVAQKKVIEARWVLKPINIVINHYGSGDVSISPRGSIKVGRVTLQRKGGDGGRETANMLQFKMNPAELFNVE